MKLRLSLSALIFIMLHITSISGQIAESADLIFPKNITEDQQNLIINNLNQLPNNTQASILIINGDESTSMGIKNNNSNLQNVTNKDSIFEIGSITKIMTSTLLANAVIDNELTLDTEISELLGYSLLNEAKITLKQLSNHTSGMKRMPDNFMFAQMKDPNNPYKYYGEKELKEWLTKYMTSELKQDASNYSNLGAALLAYGLTKKYDTSYEDMLQKQIFEKLKMTSTSTKLDQVKTLLVNGQDAKGNPCQNWEFDVLAGAGAVMSNITDMEKFVRAVMSKKDKALALQMQPTFTVNDNMEIGLAWHIIHGKGGHTFYWHNGGTSGYTSSLLVDMDRQLAVIVLSNLSAFHVNTGNIDGLSFGLMKTFNK